MSLTPAGLERWQDVVALTFNAIDKIRSQGVTEGYFQENARLSQLAFRFHEKSEPIHLVSSLAREMQDVAPQDVLRAPYMMAHYAPEAYRDILDRLTPRNVLVALLSPEPLPKDSPTTEWYDTPYQMRSLDMAQLLRNHPVTDLAAKLALPEPNPFVPDNVELTKGATMDRPEQLIASPIALWYARDTSFGTPKANVYLNLRSPIANDSPRDAALTHMLVAMISDQLSAFSYPAQLAGLDFSIYSHLRGISLKVGDTMTSSMCC